MCLKLLLTAPLESMLSFIAILSKCFRFFSRILAAMSKRYKNDHDLQLNCNSHLLIIIVLCHNILHTFTIKALHCFEAFKQCHYDVIWWFLIVCEVRRYLRHVGVNLFKTSANSLTFKLNCLFLLQYCIHKTVSTNSRIVYICRLCPMQTPLCSPGWKLDNAQCVTACSRKREESVCTWPEPGQCACT